MTRTPRQLDALAWRAAEQLGDNWEVTRREKTALNRDEWMISFHERSDRGLATASAQATVSVDEMNTLSDDDLVAWILVRVRSSTAVHAMTRGRERRA